MRRYSTLILVLIAGFTMPARAVEAVANYALFRTETGQAYVELYWQINTTSLHYKKDAEGKLTARVRTQIRITGDTGIVHTETFYLQTKAFNPEKEDAAPILEIARAEIPRGHIKLELYLSEDGHPAGAYYHRDTFSIPSTTGPAYSSLQLLDTFLAQPIAGPFEKGGFQQLPRALPFYDEGQRRLHAYTELYGLGDLPPGSFPLTQLLYLSKRKGERDIGGHAHTDTIQSASALLRFRKSITLADLPSGNYHVNVSLRSAAGVELASAATFFQMINKHPEIVKVEGKAADTATKVEQVEGAILDLGKTFVAKFDMAQLRAILKMLLPGAEPSQQSAIKSFLDRPDELYTRYFVYNHFLNRNRADPARAWKLFSDTVREVNRLYKSGSTMGYETDRGVIHLRYGPPTEVVRVPNEAGAVPYEIWRYNVGAKIQGSGLFLFYSPGYMSSDFRLLHSTVRGERNNPAWRDVLYSSGRSSGNVNARAEEYFGR